MKTTILVFVAFFSMSLTFGQATTTEITCKFKKNVVKGTFSVAMSNLMDPQKAELAEIYTNYEGEDTAFSYDGNEDMEWFWYLLLSWDNGYGFDEAGNFVMALDSDGCDVGVLKLFKNTNYRYGYTKVAHNCSGDVPDTYDTLICKVQEK